MTEKMTEGECLIIDGQKFKVRKKEGDFVWLDGPLDEVEEDESPRKSKKR
jgi:hypothetical protein